MNPKRVVALAIVLGGVVTACADAGTATRTAGQGPFPMTVSDCGRPVVLEQRPQRVLTMGSTAALLMWAAGATGSITTRSNEGGVPLGPAEQALADITQISPDQDLSREVIIGLQPDLVLTYGLNMTTAEDLSVAGIDSIVNSGFCDGDGSGPNPDGKVDFDDVFRDIRLYGRIFGTEEAATAKVERLRERVAAVEGRYRDAPPLTGAAMILTPTSISAYGLPNMTHAQLAKLGIRNVFGDVPDRIAEIGVEELISRDPDVLILLSGGAGSPSERQARKALRTLPGIERVTAVREDRIIMLESPFILGSPLAIEGLEAMAAKFRSS